VAANRGPGAAAGPREVLRVACCNADSIAKLLAVLVRLQALQRAAGTSASHFVAAARRLSTLRGFPASSRRRCTLTTLPAANTLP